MSKYEEIPGTLRELKIQPTEDDFDSKFTRPSEKKLPRQTVKSRQSGVVEWDQNEELWNEWKREVQSELSHTQRSEPIKNVSGEKLQTKKKEQGIPKFEPEKEKSENILRNQLANVNEWAVELAIQERNLDKEGVVDYGAVLHKQELLKLKTKEFMSRLQELFRLKVELFNQSRRDPSHHIHIYKVSKSDEDFMLYRNSVKLVVSGREVGKIVFAFNQFLGQVFHNQQQPITELNAQWGVFDQLLWAYKGERVETEEVVRYFLTQFAQQSYK